MTRKEKERLSNRLVLNFGVLLAAGLILLYVNSALRSGGRSIAYWVILIAGILGAVGAAVLFFWGRLKKPAIKNYSAVGLGLFIGCAMLYVSKLGWIPGYTHVRAVIAVYIAMAAYFIVMAIITGIMLRKPLIKTESEKITHTAKSKKKKRK
ncbi:MAG: hypothetical protein E7414_05230 [Ruminococcaceae bacterium]|nr:hypothetical protein [Oscillospiraceae bacterium]